MSHPARTKFLKPPVAETVISVQFTPISDFSAVHAGDFWQRALSELPEWKDAKLEDKPRIDDVFEEFGELKFVRPSLEFRENPGFRSQIIQADDERMIQVQSSRFVYNWRRRSGDYPSYTTTRPAFDAAYRRFTEYLSGRGFAVPEPNQWEVTYINHIPRGSLWNEVTDWPKILPGLYVPEARPHPSSFETINAAWRYRLPEDRGRLYIHLQHGRRGQPTVGEMMVLHLTARGPVDASRQFTLTEGLDLGHESIVSTFESMTSADAHEHWGRQS